MKYQYRNSINNNKDIDLKLSIGSSNFDRLYW